MNVQRIKHISNTKGWKPQPPAPVKTARFTLNLGSAPAATTAPASSASQWSATTCPTTKAKRSVYARCVLADFALA